jgi:ABC-2 type transport system ATP-binding protein
MANVIIEAKGLGRDYGMARALDDVSITLEAGAPIGLVGPNGAGKTTFFSVLCGFLTPTRGTVEVLGRPPLHRDLHGRVAILPQDAALVKGVAVLVQLTFFAELQGFSGEAARAEAKRALDVVGLGDAVGKPPEAMSHGMLKRVGIAQAFIGSPEVVLLDEPTAGLDPATATQIKNLIRSLDQNRTFVISSHNLDDIEELCGTIVLLNKGKISDHRKVSDLIGRTSCLTFRLEKEAPEDVAQVFASVPGVTRVERGQPGERRLMVHFRDAEGDYTQIVVLQALSKAGLGFLEMSRGQSLEDRVLELTRK